MNKFKNIFFYKEDDGGAGGGEGGEGAPPEGGEATPPPAEGGTPPPEGGTPPPATPPASTDPLPLIDKDGNFKENWWEDYDDLKDDASILQNFKTPNGLAKSLANTKRMVGKPFDPNNFADDADKAKFYKELGVPDEATGYEFVQPEDFPADQKYDPTHDEWFANIAKKYNVPKEAATGIRKEYASIQFEAKKAATAEAATQHEKSMEKLENKFGPEGSTTYQASLDNVDSAITAMDNIYDGDLRADIKSIGMDDEPVMFMILEMIGANVGESELAGVEKGASGKTKDQALARIHEIEADPEFFKPNSQKQKDMVKERHALRKSIHGEK